MSNNEKPDWDKITEGKIRHGFAVAAFTNKMEMTDELCSEIECWVRYVVDGKKSIQNERVSNLPFNKILNSLDVEDESESSGSMGEDKGDVKLSEEIVKVIRDKAGVLSTSDRNKVIESLENGHITEENLDICLKRIEELANSKSE